jgi:hypothetical protein
MRKLFFLLAFWGCGDNNSSVSVGNSNPLGTVGGVVLEGATEMPVAGAMVKIVAGGKVVTATSDSDGIFSAANVPSGNFIATIGSTGYLTASINGTLGGAVGNFPVKDPITTLGPIGLVKNDGTFSVKIVDDQGTPVANVAVVARPQVRWINFSNGRAEAMGDYAVSATSDANGIATFMGLPDYTSLGALFVDNLPIDVPPMQVMGSMTVYSFLGGSFSFQVNHLANNDVIDIPIIRLASQSTPLIVLNSNIDILRGMQANQNGTPVAPSYTVVSVIPYIGMNAKITVEFNQVINKSSVRAQLYNEDGTTANVMMMTAPNDNVLTITPASALTAGTRYNLTLHVDAAELTGQTFASRELDTTIPLFVEPAAGASVKVSLMSPPKSLSGPSPQPFTFQFTEPVGVGFGSQYQGGVSCIVFYDTGTVNLDNGAPDFYPGEYNPMMKTGYTCPNTGLDITKMVPLEASQFPITGFATKWQITYDLGNSAECKPPSTVNNGCSVPATGTQVYLKPGRASDSLGRPLAFKRPDGTTVPDNDQNLSFAIPPP